MPSEISQAAARVRVGRLAADQHGVFHLDQALGLGMSRDAVYRSCRKGEWRRLLHKVFATAAARWQWPMVACLWGGSGSATSHRCAGELWELDGVPSGFVEITRIGTSLMSNSKVIVHRASSSVPSQRVDGIPFTSVTRTIVDLSSVLDAERLELALEDALRRRVTSLPRLEAALAASGGYRGTKVLRGLVTARLDLTRPTESALEVKVLQLLRRSGLPKPTVQHTVRVPGGAVRLDFAYPDTRVAIEVDGYRWHSARAAWARDRTRLNALVAMGWRVLHVTNDEIRREAPALVRDLRGLLAKGRLSGE